MDVSNQSISERTDSYYVKIQKLYEAGDINTALEVAGQFKSIDTSATFLDVLVNLYIDISDLQNAKKCAEDSLNIRENICDEFDNDLATSYNNLGEVYRRLNDLENAEKYARNSLNIRENLYKNINNNDLANSLNNLAGVYESQGKFNESEELYERALEIRKKLYLKAPNRCLAITLNDIGYLYESKYKFREAEEKYREAIRIFDKVFQGTPNDNLAFSLCNLAGVCRNQKKWSEVESLYQRALKIRENIFINSASLSLFQSYNNFAGFYREQGNLSKSEELFDKALVTLKNLGSYSLVNFEEELAICYNNLAKLYYTQGRSRESGSYFRKAIEILQKNESHKKAYLAKFQNNLGELYFKQNKLSKAKECYEASLDIYDQDNNKNNDYAQTCGNFGDIYLEQKKFSEAEKEYNNSLKARLNLFHDNDNNDLSISYINLAKLYICTDRLSSALDCMTTALDIQNKWLRNLFAYSSESQRLLYVKQAQQSLSEFLSLVCQYYLNDKLAVKLAFNTVLQRKALATEVAALFNYTLCGNHYPDLQDKFNELLDLQQKLGTMITNPSFRDKEEINQLREDRDRLQRELASQVPEIARDNREVSTEKISKSLPTGSLFIELVRVKWVDFNAPKKQSQKDHYLAFSMIQGQIESLQLNDLGDANLIDLSVEKFRKILRNGRSNVQKKQSGYTLYRKIMAPILNYYLSSKVESLVIAPDGVLHLIPFHCLPLNQFGEKILIDRYRIEYLTTGRDLFRHSNLDSKALPTEPIIIADPDYNWGKDIQNLSSDSKPNSLGDRFSRLDITEEFAKRLGQRLRISPCLGIEATTNQLDKTKLPQILAIATHGFSINEIPNQQKDEEISDRLYNRDIEDPMSRCGLAFAGANSWRESIELAPEMGKGILFAHDISQLNLWSTELVVLVACSSGIGDIEIGEGVSGLRHAFTIAGCKNLITSLWDVPLYASILLMDKFFDYYTDTVNTHTPSYCLHMAQDYIRNSTIESLNNSQVGKMILEELTEYEYISRNSSLLDCPVKHPFFWAAWICQG
jgi:tetratricopeptide (TPR) repeat protein